MRRNFIKPLLDLYDPFPIHRFFTPMLRYNGRSAPENYQIKKYQNIPEEKNDPHQIFQQFFKENQIKQAEKDFFKKHYPTKLQEPYDPYKILEISKEATEEEIKNAYRNLALKYHPKNNSEPNSAEKFAEVGKAYETLVNAKKRKDLGELSTSSFFEDFQKDIDEFFNLSKSQKAEKGDKNHTATEPSKENGSSVKENGSSVKDNGSSAKQNTSNFGELYSESSNFQTVNGKQTKYVLERVYKKNGKFLLVKRQEHLKKDGKIEIIQTVDNGIEVKKKQYIQQKDAKKISN